MKNHFLFLFILGVIAFGGIEVAAQCDPSSLSPIRCSYYNEGYLDGASDAQSGRGNDYRRYRSKYNRTYENNFRDGYDAGYNSAGYDGGSSARWTTSQRNAYNAGYNIGVTDRRSGGSSRRAETYGGYDQNIGQYFQLGYRDAFENRPRTYDQPLGGGTIYPPIDPGTGGGFNTATWGGRVDDRANIIIRGGSIRSEDASGTGLQVAYQNINGSLGRRATTVSARRTGGRGSVIVIQQPSRFNDFTAIVQVVDTRGGADDYRVEISWTGGGFGGGPIVDDPYRSGSVRWSGRVDQTASIIISGGDVETRDESGTGVSNVNFNITGVLVRRSGSVTVRKRNGRGTVRVLQQPSRDNDFTAIVQIFDPGSGADNYELDINW